MIFEIFQLLFNRLSIHHWPFYWSPELQTTKRFSVPTIQIINFLLFSTRGLPKNSTNHTHSVLTPVRVIENSIQKSTPDTRQSDLRYFVIILQSLARPPPRVVSESVITLIRVHVQMWPLPSIRVKFQVRRHTSLFQFDEMWLWIWVEHDLSCPLDQNYPRQKGHTTDLQKT